MCSSIKHGVEGNPHHGLYDGDKQGAGNQTATGF
jgi:hypothetical protein